MDATANLAFIPTSPSRRFQTAGASHQDADAILIDVEAMLMDSYSHSQSSDEWWLVFSAYYQGLQIDANTRAALNSRLDWLFCHHGETGWSGVRQTLLAMEKGHRVTTAGSSRNSP